MRSSMRRCSKNQITATPNAGPARAAPRAHAGRRALGGRAFVASGRRGSALIIVIGTLALIAVFAAIYISIGQSDRRTASTVRIRRDRADFTATIADHIARIIGDDRLDATLQYADSRLSLQVPRRETTDAPYTDWWLRSEVPEGQEYRLFTPPGGNLFPVPRGARFDPRVSSDPWLAALRPTYLGPVYTTAGLPATRPFSYGAPNDPYGPSRTYLDNRDWLQISNLAPDGRFVNLFNLRNNFDAEPGWGQTVGVGRGPTTRLSEGLTLYRVRTPGDPYSAIESFDPTLTQEVWLPGSDVPVGGVLSANEIRNTPAVWTMYQRFSLIPLDQPFVTYVAGGGVATWADPAYPAYQWADTDRNGFADSRWFELTSARSDQSGGSARRTDVEKLYDAGDLRVFAAARVIDLSALANVNVATDGLIPPTEEHPLGLTPAEVDLRRLLTMQDASSAYDSGYVGFNGYGFPLSFASLHRPFSVLQSGQDLEYLVESDVRRYRYDDGFVPGSILNPDGTPLFVGRYAASAVRRAIQRHSSLTEQFRGAMSVPPVPANDPFHLPEGSSFLRPGDNPDDFNTLAKRRADSYHQVGAINPLRLGRAGSMSFEGVTAADSQYYGMGLFGLDDLAELLTYHGVNDPETNSRLERVTTGRYDGPEGEDRFSPLLTTRTLALDRLRHGWVEDGPAGSNPNRPRIVDGSIASESMALLALSPRKLITPLSGAVRLRPRSVVGGTGQFGGAIPVDGLSLSEATTTLRTLAEEDMDKAFDVYYSALAGELEAFRDKRGNGGNGLPPGVINQIWQTDLGLVRRSPYATLFYAHRGPELAVRVASHTAANTKDMFDEGQTPSVATLVLDNAFGDSTEYESALNAFRDDPAGVNLLGAGNGLAVFYPGIAAIVRDADDGDARDEIDPDGQLGLFDLDGPRVPPDRATPDERRVLPENLLPPARQVVNVFGVEPMPVITEVASMYVYSDNPAGDVESTGRPDPFEPTARVTLSTSLNDANGDLMAEVLAVQIHNPTEVPIVLGGTGAGPDGIMWRNGLNNPNPDGSDPDDRFNADNNLLFNYYLEFNGRFFKLGEFQEFLPIATRGDGFDATDINTLNEQGLGSIPVGDQTIRPGTLPEFQYRTVVLGPGETRVFYAMAHGRFDWPLSGPTAPGLDQRWERALAADPGGVPVKFVVLTDNDADSDGRPDSWDGKGWTGPAQEWIERQFKVDGAPAVRVHEFDPRTGGLVNEDTFVDLIANAGNLLGPTRVADATAVRLWRKLTIDGVEEVPDSERSGPDLRENLVQNDMLVDRMKLATPSEGSLNYLDVALDTGQSIIAGTIAYDPSVRVVDNPCDAPPNVLNVRNDNTGVSVVRWASVRRRDRPAGMNGNEFGRVLPWMVQSRRDPASTWIRSSNAAGHPNMANETVPARLDVWVFFQLCGPPYPVDSTIALTPAERFDEDSNDDPRLYDIAYTVRELYASSLQGNRNKVASIQKSPFDKAETVYPPMAGSRFPVGELDKNTVDDFLYGGNAGDPRPEIFARKSAETPRIAEALLATGIGPTWAPDLVTNPRPASSAAVFADEWMTLSEAYAVALGYEDITYAPTDASPDIVWHDAVRPIISGEPEYVLDDLRLRLDDYVAFLNVNTANETNDNERPAFTVTNPINPQGSDARRGTGAPLALGVIDQFRAFAPIEMPSNTTNPTEEEVWLTRPMMGLVNVNTAPIEILRLLPGLTPSIHEYRTLNSATPIPEWWGAPGGLADGAGVAKLDPSVSGDTPDVAAGLVAYRDRLPVSPRYRSLPGSTILSYQTALIPPEPFLLNRYVEDISAKTDRATLSGAEALRGAPGFGSLGELMMLSIENGALAPAQVDDLRHLTMTNYALDNANLGVDGTGEHAVSIDPKFSGGEAGVVVDDYAEQLAMAAGIMNMTSVRSDYFAAWFVIQGFRESDVSGLRPEDALVPSFKKRFLMVIDRSNVVEPGDSPRVVLFKELPL